MRGLDEEVKRRTDNHILTPFLRLAPLVVGLSQKHVTVMNIRTGKTQSGARAPKEKNLKAWLEAHPGWKVWV